MRLTRRGFGVLFAAIMLMSVGLAVGYPELTVIGCAGLVALTVALLWALRRWTLLVSRDVEPDRVTRGERCQGVVTVRNTARWRSVDVIAFDQCANQDIPVPMLRLSPGKSITARYGLPTHRRGVVQVGPLRIQRRDPLDLIRKTREFGQMRHVWVHPLTHQLHSMPAGAARSLDGVVDKIERGNITFHALREYVPGDDLRHVHWRTSARIGELMVREHVDTTLPKLVVLLDDRPDPLDESGEIFEEIVEVAASVLLAGLRDGLNVGLHLVSGATSLDSQTDRSPQVFLDVLAEARLASGAINQAVARLRHRRIGDTLVVLTGISGEMDLEGIAQLRSVYPSIVTGVIGRPGAGTRSQAGMLIIGARNAADFARAWGGVKTW